MGAIEIAARGQHTASVIFLHGLGDSGASWAPVCRDFLAQPHIKVGALSEEKGSQFVCPSAPIRAVTMNGGAKMPSWFDRKGLAWESPTDEKGLAESTALVHSLVGAEVKALGSSNRVLVAGFSQGGALALHSTLTYPSR